MEAGDFSVFNYSIKVSKLNEPIYLIPFGDLHYGSPLFHKEKWAEFIEWAKDKPRCLFLGMGDYFDMSSTSERKLLLSPDLHESTLETLEEWYEKQVQALYGDIRFMDGNLIGLIEGNHYSVYNSGITTTQHLAQLTKSTYLGTSAFVRLSFTPYPKTTASTCIDIFAHHGTGAARKHGTSLLAVERMAEVAEADIYLAGHDHKKTASLASRLQLSPTGNKPKLSQRKILLGRTGSFLKGYVPNKRSYIARKMLPPTDLGVLKIELTPKRYREDGRDTLYVDIHASI
jgi:hypothetical protein